MARPRTQPTDRVATAIRVPRDLHDRLSEAAFDRDLPINFLVVKAIEAMLDNLIPVEELRLTRSTQPRKDPS